MTSKERNLEDDFQNRNPSLAQYVDLVDKAIDSPEAIFDDILMVEERYQESRVINQGGMKKILKTIDSLTGRPVAKAALIDFEDSEKVENFLKEARLTAALEHPNIMPVYDIGVDETEGPFFTMKLVGGQNLGGILKDLSKTAGEPPAFPGNVKTEGEYSLQDLMEIFLKICDAVAYAHSRGVVHLDLKPENIQVGDYGEVLVCDWGLAKVLEEAEDITEFSVDLDPYIYNGLTLDGYIKGTPGYMAPEQIDKVLGPKNLQTDIYALGGILYSLLCYKAPFESDTLDGVLKETLNGTLLSPSERDKSGGFIPGSLEAVALKALQIKPELRYQSVSDLRREISKWMRGFATEAEDAGFMRAFWLLLKRHKAVSVLLFILTFSGILAVTKISHNEKIALANEKKALNNEKETKKALTKYLNEKELNVKINEHAIEQVLSRNKIFLNNFEFDKAIDIIDRSLIFQPKSEKLHAHKGELHFYRQEFKEAVNAFEKAGSFIENQPYEKMNKVSDEYAEISKGKEFLAATDLKELILSFKDEYRARLFQFEAQKFKLKRSQSFKSYLLNRSLLKNHLELCRLMTLSAVVPDKLMNFKYTFDDDGINLDLSNCDKDVKPPKKYLDHLPLKHLDVSNSGFWRSGILTHYYLKSIDIRGCYIQKLDQSTMGGMIRITRLKKITLTEEQYKKTYRNQTILGKIHFEIKDAELPPGKSVNQ